MWSRAGTLVRTIADLPSNETVPMLGVPVGPRDYTWNPAEPATLVWAEALDGGDLRTLAPQRDRLCVLQAPFTGPPLGVAEVPAPGPVDRLDQREHRARHRIRPRDARAPHLDDRSRRRAARVRR